MLFSTSVCFDISLLELLAPLCRGGKLIVVQNVLELPDCAAASEVTFINTVPSAMTELIGIDGVGESVRGIGLAGEAVSAALIRRCYQLPNVKTVFNLYGPTEDTIYSTYWVVPRENTGAPAIGQPLAGSRAYILDTHLEPLPIGIGGELYLGGSKLARGYLGQPQLTVQRFVPDPRRPGQRLYRTGDLARWNPRWNHPLPGPHRPANQATRLSHRVGRNRSRFEFASSGSPVRGGGERRRISATTHGLCRRPIRGA